MKFEKFVHEIHNELRETLLLQAWAGAIYFDFPAEERDDDREEMARIQVSPDYSTYTIYCSKALRKAYKAGDNEGVRHTITHELCHIITEELYIFAVDAATNTNVKHLNTLRERWTQHIALILANLESNHA